MVIQKSDIYIYDLDVAIEHVSEIESLNKLKVLVTGATGTIGSFIVDMLLRYNQKNNAEITVIVAGRNVEKLRRRFEYWKDQHLLVFSYDVTGMIKFDVEVDYVIHAAGNAHPSAFNGDPVGTIIGNVQGTYKLLEYTKIHGGKRFLYVSSGEVYGQGDLTMDEFVENYAGYLDPLLPRSCYPQSKRATENLCASYTSQYGLETVIVRPCHTYGPEITPSDSRANAQFIRNVLNDEDIVMKSAGTQMRSYNYIADCASAIITVLLKGKSGEAYNIANPDVRITIAELAQIIAKVGKRNVVYLDPTTLDIVNQSPVAKQVLSSKKLEALGWTGVYSYEEGVHHTIAILQGK